MIPSFLVPGFNTCPFCDNGLHAFSLNDNRKATLHWRILYFLTLDSTKMSSIGTGVNVSLHYSLFCIFCQLILHLNSSQFNAKRVSYYLVIEKLCIRLTCLSVCTICTDLSASIYLSTDPLGIVLGSRYGFVLKFVITSPLNLNLNSLLVKRQIDNPSPGAVTGGN